MNGKYDSRRLRGPIALCAIGALLFAALSMTACDADGEALVFAPEDSGVDATSDDASQPPPSPLDAGDAPDARPAFDPDDEAVVCAGSPCAVELVAGTEHFCARMSDGTVRCWGSDGFGALGRGASRGDAEEGVPPVDGLAGVTQLSAAGATTCARLDDGGVSCWGSNVHGELGLDVDMPVADEDRHPTPARVPLGSPAVRVDVGNGTVCALLTSQELVCWGKDDHAQLARPEGASVVRGPGRAAIEPLAVSHIATGSYTVLARSAGGDVWTWGGIAGDEGVLSGRYGSVSPDPRPRRVDSLSDVTALVATSSIEPPPPPWTPGQPPSQSTPPPRAHACAIAKGELHCWGTSSAGALCSGLPDREKLPRRAPWAGQAWPQQVAVNDEITCVRMTDGSVACCGSDDRGRLGTGNVGDVSALLTKATALEGHAVSVATSARAVCALLQGGAVECWGSNEYGELGRAPDDDDHPIPSKVTFDDHGSGSGG